MLKQSLPIGSDDDVQFVVRLVLLVMLCLSSMVVAQTKSAEEAEADKLNADVVRLSREYKYLEALPLAKRALELREKILGAEATATHVAMKNLATVYSYLDKHKEAGELYQRLLKIQEKLWGAEDAKLCDTLSKLGWERVANRNESGGEALFKRQVQILEKAFGADAPQTLPGLSDLASYYQRSGAIDQALPLYRRMIAIQEQHPAAMTEASKAERLVKYAVLLRLRNKMAEADEMEARARKLYASRKLEVQPQKVSGGVLQGTAIMKVQPDYPPEAKRARVQGTVQVAAVIDEVGIVVSATPISGPKELHKVCEEAAKKWRFKPTELEGKPVKVQGILTFNFTLQ